MRVIPGQAERIRHHRKYAEGDVRYKSFYFRGPTGKHNLKAQNLDVFCQIAEGIGEETWMFHLRRNDYSRWMRDVIKNPDLAAAVEDIERRVDLASGADPCTGPRGGRGALYASGMRTSGLTSDRPSSRIRLPLADPRRERAESPLHPMQAARKRTGTHLAWRRASTPCSAEGVQGC